MKKVMTLLLCLFLSVTAVSASAEETKDVFRNTQEIVEELVAFYGRYGTEAEPQIKTLLLELEAADPDMAVRWKTILELWEQAPSTEIHMGTLPDGLPDTDELCIVVLGYQLNADGSMKDELVRRLEVALQCAEKYPNAFVACTGGPTAVRNPETAEAVRMAEWLNDHGISRERLIVEHRSMTTAQNAINTYRILKERFPQIHQLAIVSSDYHIVTGVLLFEAEAILQGEEAGKEMMHVVSNAAYDSPERGSLSVMFQAGALIELSGDYYTAYKIYEDTYDIYDLFPENEKVQ